MNFVLKNYVYTVYSNKLTIKILQYHSKLFQCGDSETLPLFKVMAFSIKCELFVLMGN